MNHSLMIAAAMAAGLLTSAGAWADRGRSHVGVGIGFSFGSPWGGFHPRAFHHRGFGHWPYYRDPFYSWHRYDPYYGPYYGPPRHDRRPSRNRVEHVPPPGANAPVTTPPKPVWYYCAQADGYFPYVQDCPEGWQSVSAEPPR